MAHVRISKKGFEVLNDKSISRKIVCAIHNNKEAWLTGKPFKVPGTKYIISSATTK